MVRDFVIPIQKDDLLQSRKDQYFVDKIIPIRMVPQALEASRTALQTNGAKFILDHFDTFFAVLIHGNKIEMPVVLRAFSRIHKGIEILVRDMEGIFDGGIELEDEERMTYLCINKMLAYLFSLFICFIDEEFIKESEKSTGKRKKNTRSDSEEEWDFTKQKSLEYVYRWLQLPLQKLWQPPIVEDSFITSLTKVCYKILEHCTSAREKQIRQTIFEILGTSIKRYNQGISCVIRIIQLVKFHDVLAAHIATGVVHMVTESGCNGLIREVMNEIGQTELSEADSRNISIFLETIAVSKSELIIPILDEIMDHLANEHYTMRNCTIGILGAVVQQALTGEDLTEEQKERRDECLDNIQDHMLDSNAYVRSKVLNVWQKLCCEGAIPLARQGKLLAATTLRLEDKSANVRKQALQLLRALLQSNPFAAKLNVEEISKSLKDEELKLMEMQTEFARKSARGDNQRLELWNSLLPDIMKALNQVINNEKKHKKHRDEEEEDDDSDDNNNSGDQSDESEDEKKDESEKEAPEKVDDENFDSDKAFERVRHLMLNRKILPAVTYLLKICSKLTHVPEMKKLSPDAQEECLFFMLLKIFMDSESVNPKEQKSNANNPDVTDKNKEKEIVSRKRVVNYLRNCLQFATELETAIKMAKSLLFSTTATDAVEACTLLGTAYQFGIANADSGVRDALFQAFHRDPSVKNNVALVYKEIYLKNNNNQGSGRQKAVACANSLINLIKALQPGQSPALAQLFISWYKSEELDNEVLQVLWEKFSLKLPDTTALDSRAALMLITMLSEAQSGILADNLEVLIKVGLGVRAKTDLLLARDTCRALQKIKHDSDDIEKAPLRYANDHDMFKEILHLLTSNFTNSEENGYISFATDAINAVYHLANQPDQLMKQLLVNVYNKGQFSAGDSSQQPTVPFFLLSKFLFLIGHIAIRQMVHLDTSVYKELKRRDVLRKLKKGSNTNAKDTFKRTSNTSGIVSTPSSAGVTLRNRETSSIMEDNGEEAVEGAADDADAEFINATLEGQVVTGDGLLSKFVPLILDVCQHPDKYRNEHLQAAGTLALSKFMTVSATFCEESLQLLVTILERSPYPGIRANVLIGISDLTTRFPNQIEPWMKHVYGRLRDEDITVRSTGVRVLSNLILREMVRVREHISELAICIVDEDAQIRQDAKQFFKELSQKGNTLYNVMPAILSCLTAPDLNLKESEFQEILKHILGLLQKEKQVDAIIDKICARFQLATTERQWRDFAYCLSLLQFSGKSIHRLIESLPLLKDKIHNSQVLKALQNVIEQTKKKPNAKAACLELEEKINELLKNTTYNQDPDSQAMPPPPIPKPKKSARRAQRRINSDDEDEDSENDTESTPVKNKKNSKKRKSSEGVENNSSSESEDEVPVKTPARQSAKKITTQKQRKVSSTATPSPSAKRLRQSGTSSQTSQRTSTRLSQSRNRR